MSVKVTGAVTEDGRLRIDPARVSEGEDGNILSVKIPFRLDSPQFEFECPASVTGRNRFLSDFATVENGSAEVRIPAAALANAGRIYVQLTGFVDGAVWKSETGAEAGFVCTESIAASVPPEAREDLLTTVRRGIAEVRASEERVLEACYEFGNSIPKTYLKQAKFDRQTETLTIEARDGTTLRVETGGRAEDMRYDEASRSLVLRRSDGSELAVLTEAFAVGADPTPTAGSARPASSDGVRTELDRANGRIDETNVRVDAGEQSLASLDGRLTDSNERIEASQTRISAVETDTANLGERTSNLESAGAQTMVTLMNMVSRINAGLYMWVPQIPSAIPKTALMLACLETETYETIGAVPTGLVDVPMLVWNKKTSRIETAAIRSISTLPPAIGGVAVTQNYRMAGLSL